MHQLFVLDTGSLYWSDAKTARQVSHPVPVYLIATPDGRHILVDSGNPDRLAGQPTAAPWFESKMSMSSEQTLVRQLGLLGLTPCDIDLLISTHFDFDHCGNHNLFGDCGVSSIVQAAHFAEAPFSDRYDAGLWQHPGTRYEEIDGDREIEPGITLLRTDGHANGHQSVLVEMKAGAVLLAIDAIMDASVLGDGPWPSFYFDDRERGLQSRDRLVEISSEQNASLIFGHDPEQWQNLPKSPRSISLPVEHAAIFP
jgi:N-acyl homoserine lactone hydrolase